MIPFRRCGISADSFVKLHGWLGQEIGDTASVENPDAIDENRAREMSGKSRGGISTDYHGCSGEGGACRAEFSAADAYRFFSSLSLHASILLGRNELREEAFLLPGESETRSSQ